MKKYKMHIIWAAVAVAALAGGFFYGRSMAAGAANNSGFSGKGGFVARGAGGMAAGGFVAGQVSAIDSSSITLQLPSGSSQVVFYSASTSVTEPTNVSISAIQPGAQVMIGGTQNSDGSMTAQNIQVRNGSSSEGFFGGARVRTGQ